MADGIDLDSMLGQKVFIFFKTLDQILFLEALLPTTRGLRRYNPALNLGLNTVGTWFILITADFALLA
jgi:hypothetical protein